MNEEEVIYDKNGTEVKIECNRFLPKPGVVLDPGYVDTNFTLPDGNWKAQVPADSFYDFVNKPEDNAKAFEDLINGIAGTFQYSKPPTLTATKEMLDKIAKDLGTIQPIPSIMNKITEGAGIPLDFISTGKPNKNGNIYSKTTMDSTEYEALTTEMNILKGKNDSYLEIIALQSDTLKSKDQMIAKLSKALNDALIKKIDGIEEVTESPIEDEALWFTNPRPIDGDTNAR